MKILLIEPPFHRFMGFYRYFFPFSLSSISSFLGPQDHDILIYDADHGEKPVVMTSSDLLDVFPKYIEGIGDTSHPLWTEVEDVVRNFRPDLIGITYMSTKMGAVKNIVDISKRVFPDVPIVLGGAHPSVFPEASLRQTRANFVVLGEGEKTFRELVAEVANGGRNFEKIRGLAFVGEDGKMVVTPPRPLIKEINSLPFPDRESLYRLETYRPDDLSMIMTSRGCPYNCTFCSSIWERKVRNRSLPNIIEEMEYLIRRFNAENISFKDDTFTIDRKRILEFCRLLKERGLKVNWDCLTRIELLDEELVREMRETGMINLKIGIETGSPRLLRETNKKLTIEQIKRGSALLKKLGQKWSAFFMVGYPDETEEEVFMTWKLIEEIQPTYVSMSILVPYPGSQSYYDLEKLGAIGEKSDWNLYDPFSLETHFTQNIGRERFRELAIHTMNFVDGYNFRRESPPKSL